MCILEPICIEEHCWNEILKVKWQNTTRSDDLVDDFGKRTTWGRTRVRFRVKGLVGGASSVLSAWAELPGAMHDCLERDSRSFTPGASAPTYWVTSFMAASLETERSGTHCSRQTAFLPFAASMQIRALELFFVSSLRLMLLATLRKIRKRRCWIWIGFNGRAGWWRYYQAKFQSESTLSDRLLYNKQAIQIKEKHSVSILVCCAATEVEKEKEKVPWKVINSLSLTDTVIDYWIELS